MTINMEVKKHALQQLQDGSWKLTFMVHSDDMSMELVMASMGSPYGLAMVPIQYDDTPPNLDHFTEYEMKPLSDEKKAEGRAIIKRMGEKSEGEKLRQRACILCGEGKFQQYCIELGYFYTTSDTGDVRFGKESTATNCIYAECNIESRRELVTNKEAQTLFLELMEQYNDWKFENNYDDNLTRY